MLLLLLLLLLLHHQTTQQLHSSSCETPELIINPQAPKKKCSRTFNITFFLNNNTFTLFLEKKECFCINVFSASIDDLIHVKELPLSSLTPSRLSNHAFMSFCLSYDGLCDICWRLSCHQNCSYWGDVFPAWNLHSCSQQIMNDGLHFQFINAAAAAAPPDYTAASLLQLWDSWTHHQPSGTQKEMQQDF